MLIKFVRERAPYTAGDVKAIDPEKGAHLIRNGIAIEIPQEPAASQKPTVQAKADDEAEQPVKRKRGRPRKIDLEDKRLTEGETKDAEAE